MEKFYRELAHWWPLLSPVEEYAEEAEFFLNAMKAGTLLESPSLLELGCGGGNNAFYLKQHFASVVLTDLSPHMLAVSQALNPECEHQQGDMRTLQLNRTFDAVFIHDAIEYMATPADLSQALQTAFNHCKPGGVTVIAPDHVLETYTPSTEHGGEDVGERGLRYLQWSHAANDDNIYAVDYIYTMREEDGTTHIEHEQHIHRLYPRTEWLRLLSETGFQTNIVRDDYERDIFIARRPTGDSNE